MRGHLARVTENLNLNIKMVTYRTTRDIDEGVTIPKLLEPYRTFCLIML